jgi:hypothetical protein
MISKLALVSVKNSDASSFESCLCAYAPDNSAGSEEQHSRSTDTSPLGWERCHPAFIKLHGAVRGQVDTVSTLS